MQRIRMWAVAALVPALALAILAAGCGDKGTSKTDGGGGDKKDNGGKGDEKKALEAKGRGTIKGKVTFAGDKPDTAKATAELRKLIEAHKDRAHCEQGAKPDELEQQEWKIDDKGGLAEVLVWVAPPEGYYFKLDKSDLTLTDMPGSVDVKAEEVILDQPHCAFIPHAFALFPQYYDPESKSMKPTGQKVSTTNTSGAQHNTKWKGNKNREDQVTLDAGKKGDIKGLTRVDDEVEFQCNLHPWMRAYARTFDHPFVAVTKPNGEFEIKNVPAGVDLQIIAWHPAGKYLGTGGAKGEKIKVEADKDAEKNFEAKK